MGAKSDYGTPPKTIVPGAPVSPEEIRELGKRARRIIESGEGLELTGRQQTQQKADKGRIR